jgi:hypothetical protein
MQIDGRLDKKTLFMGIVAVDCFNKTGEIFKRIASFDLASGYSWDNEPNILEANRMVRDFNKKSYTLNEYFNLVANTHIANRLGWINVPVDKLLYNVPDYLSHSSREIKIAQPDCGTFCLTVLSTADEKVNQAIMECFKESMRQALGGNDFTAEG